MTQQPLIAAAMMGHADIVGLLLHEGHDPQTVGANGATALMVAASMGHLLTIDVLIQHGANVDYRHKFAGSTAIQFFKLDDSWAYLNIGLGADKPLGNNLR